MLGLFSPSWSEQFNVPKTAPNISSDEKGEQRHNMICSIKTERFATKNQEVHAVVHVRTTRANFCNCEQDNGLLPPHKTLPSTFSHDEGTMVSPSDGIPTSINIPDELIHYVQLLMALPYLLNLLKLLTLQIKRFIKYHYLLLLLLLKVIVMNQHFMMKII